MVACNFTPEQRDAISSHGENLLVAAGAGSGKTTVLVERIIAWLLAGGEIDRLLALTFTNAAAAEMRARIDLALARAVAERPGDAHLQRQSALVQQASISTIHSFCLELLRANYYRLGLPPTFRVAGELETALLKKELLDEVLETEYARAGGMLPALADAYGGSRDDSALAGLIGDLYEFSLSRPEPEQWLRGAAAGYGLRPRLDDYFFAPLVERYLQEAARAALDELSRASRLGNGVPLAWREQLAGEQAALSAALAAGLGLEQRMARLAAVEFGRLKNIGKAWGDCDEQGNIINVYDEAAKERFKERRGAAKKLVSAARKRFCPADPDAARRDLARLAPLMNALVELVISYGQRLDAEKRRRGLVDFADMEHLALALLRMDEVAEDLRGRFNEVLIDEYQDINEVQEAILLKLASQGGFFAVGDVKQSIYRFRLAEPALFLDKYHRYGVALGGRRIDLNRNYRSDRAVIDGVNFLFRQLMTAEATEIDYDEDAELKPGRETEGVAPELLLVDLAAAEENAPAPPALLAEGRLIARKILALREQGYAYRDMAVLLRSTRNRGQVIVAALREAGVPALADGEENYTESAEVSLLVSLLQIIDNPRQDIPLAAVLRSPLFGFTADELVEIRLLNREGGFYQALRLAGEGGPLSQKTRRFWATLDRWRRLAGEKKVSELLLAIYRESGLPHLAGAMEDGAQRTANLRLLVERARQYEQTGYAGLFRFIRLLEDSRALAVREGAARLIAKSGDAVRVMSIHRSKGLEFPVVFVPGLNTRFNEQDERADVIWESRLGLGARLSDRAARRKYPTLAHSAVARRLHELALAEELRVLYVALTRARERLVLTAAVNGVERVAAAWAVGLEEAGPALPAAKIVAARQPLDWVGPALLRHSACCELRAWSGQKVACLDGPGPWQIAIFPAAELTAPAGRESSPIETPPAAEEVDASLAAQVNKALRYVYPYQQVCAYPAKWSVSALNRLARTEEERAELVPRFPAPAENLPAEEAARRGTAYHRIMELLRYDDLTPAGIATQAAAMAEQGELTPEQAQSVDSARIAAFFATPVGQALAAAPRVLREIPFTMSLELDEADSVLVQGVLDAAFEQDGGWVLLDYKTGGLGQSDREIISAYREQMDCYAAAIERLFRAPVQAVYLCLLDAGRNIKIK